MLSSELTLLILRDISTKDRRCNSGKMMCLISCVCDISVYSDEARLATSVYILLRIALKVIKEILFTTVVIVVGVWTSN